MRLLVRQARRYAAVDATVLITGETGTGKDALAHYLHAAGPRRREPFVTVDCPGLPVTLVEAELFGHERGAFTDATASRPGRFELAGRGTLYLDSITSLEPAAQGALLRVVEERKVTRLGGTAASEVRARIVASADATIERAVDDGSFSAELFHRLRVLPMHVPPLRERPEDILPLARTFLADLSARMQRDAPAIAPDAQEAMLRYRWPGNVRELQHVIERILVGGDGGVITASTLPLEVLEGGEAYFAPTASARPTLDEVERRYILHVLEAVGGSRTIAARVLGLDRKTLYRRLKAYGVAED